MFLREHDAKQVLRAAGIPVPDGMLLTGAPFPNWSAPLPAEGWMVKAQVPGGGRGKMGGVRRAADWPAVLRESRAMLGSVLGPHLVAAVRAEARVAGALEAYISLSVAPAKRMVRIMAAAQGGVEIEALHAAGQVRTALSLPDACATAASCQALAAAIDGPAGASLAAAGAALARAFVAHELIMLEINPLFVLPDGGWVAGDAKMQTDDNALDRNPGLQAMLAENEAAYPAPHLKWRYDFDYVVLDEAGEIGLLTTGAGLSMLLVDELRARGLRPYNFLDVRTGGMNGSPDRLIQVLRWIARGSRVRAVLCNIFAGATDLAEFARLLLAAREAVLELRVPLVVRLVGNGLEGARTVLEDAGIGVTSDLEEAIARLVAVMGIAGV